MNLRQQLITIFLLFDGCIAIEFGEYFKNCYLNSPEFDSCIVESLNAIRPYFKTGLPKYNVAPFDPFYAKEVSVRRGLPNAGFKLTLKNITESGWTASKVTKFYSDLSNYKITYTQKFPKKKLVGGYDFSGSFLGSTINNKGRFTLTLYDLVQTTTITSVPKKAMDVKVNVQSIKDLELHISNLLQGRNFLEEVLDRIINGVWQPGFAVIRPLINELVSTAFTEIFGKAFKNFPFQEIIKSKPFYKLNSTKV